MKRSHSGSELGSHWQSPCLACFGMPTSKAYQDLVEKTRKLAIATSKVKAPDAKPRPMSSSGPGRFVRPPQERLNPVGPVSPEDGATQERLHEIMSEHVRVSLSDSCSPPAFSELGELPEDCEAAIQGMFEKGPDLPQWRKAQVQALRICAQKARSLGKGVGLDQRLKIAAQPPENVRLLVRDINIAFVCVLIDALHYPDVKLPWLLASGMPIAGDITEHVSNVYQPVVHQETQEEFAERWELFEDSHEQFLDDYERCLLRQVRLAREEASADAANNKKLLHLQEVDKMTKAEVRKGLMGPRLSKRQLRDRYRDELGRISCQVMPRFCVEQGVTQKKCDTCRDDDAPCAQCEGLFMPKLRCADNGRLNGTNYHTRVGETVFLPSFEFPAHVGAAVARIARAREQQIPALQYSLDDLFAAYRRIGARETRFTVVAMYDFEIDQVVYHDVYGMNFGLKSAPVQFCRIPQFLVCAARLLLAVAATHYVDDYLNIDFASASISCPFAVGPSFWPSSAQWALDQLHEIVGYNLEPKKRKPGADKNIGLGVECDLSAFESDSVISFRATEERKKAILDLMLSAKQNNYLSPHEAQVVLGRLTWVLSSSYASSGRAATLPLVDRAAKRDSLDMPARNQFSWNRALDFSFEFFVRFFAVLPPLRFDFNISQRRKVVVYSDASFSTHRAGMGIVLLDCESGQRWVCGLEIPSWILRSLEDRETQINQLELLTILCAVLTFGDSHMRGRDVLFFCDNCSALCAAVHGYARSTDMALLSNALHLELASLQCRSWFEWVPSKANISDIPSRLLDFALDIFSSLGIRQWPSGIRLPTRELLESPTLDWLFRRE